jgi:hypothetical protein
LLFLHSFGEQERALLIFVSVLSPLLSGAPGLFVATHLWYSLIEAVIVLKLIVACGKLPTSSMA